MNIINSNHQKNVVSLEELVPQHDCLKLLILHTPYTLKIDTLNLCINLVKLDLSKNNLQTFPYLGDLHNLKFMFIHDNKLDVACLKNIFQQNGNKSILSRNIIWVTFWGNKNSFLGRHFIVNQTKAIAVDKHMIAFEQRINQIQEINSHCALSFSQETDISQLLTKKQVVNRHASEDQYMKELWLELKFLRKKQQLLQPIIKIQKVFRGWIIRRKNSRKKQQINKNNEILKQCFSQLKVYCHRTKRLTEHLTKLNKQYLLLSVKNIKKKEIEIRLVEWARRAKQRTLYKKTSLIPQFRFYTSLKSHYNIMKTLYRLLQLSSSKSILIHQQNIKQFENVIIPFAKKFNLSAAINCQTNTMYELRQLYVYHSPNAKEFIKIIQTNQKSSLYKKKNKFNDKKRKLMLFQQNNLKPLFKKIYFNTIEVLHSKQLASNLEINSKIASSQLYEITADFATLKDLVRGIYFYNKGLLTQNIQPQHRINFITQSMAERNSASVLIQKIWRGYIFRKKNNQLLKSFCKIQRATVIVQRWFRRLKYCHRKIFLRQSSLDLKKMTENSFYILLDDYFKEISKSKEEEPRMKFLEQNIKVYMNKQTDKLSVCWNEECTDTMNCRQAKKDIFYKTFFRKNIDDNIELLQSRITNAASKKSEHCSLIHFFHHMTENSIISHQNKKYLQIKCIDKREAKFRVFMISLLCYRMKSSQKINVFSSNHFKTHSLNSKTIIAKDPITIISNSNVNFIKNIEKRIENQSKFECFTTMNRIYLQNNQKKPVKIEEYFYIYFLNTVDPLSKIEVFTQHPLKRSKTFIAENQKIKSNFTLMGAEKYFLTEPNEQFQEQDSSIISDKIIRPSKNMKIIIKKRSVKQFKIQKKAKMKTPSFMLDSVSINDRLTTQPDYVVQPTLDRSRLKENASEQKITPIPLQNNRNSQRNNNSFESKINDTLKRKELDKFTKKFVNMNNFIQKQYVSENRRRIRTEIQNGAAESADKIKKAVQKSYEKRDKSMIEKHSKIRQKHIAHQEIVERSQIIATQHASQLKTEISLERENKFKEKSKLKKLKITFAEECYPLALKVKQKNNFD